MCNPRGKGCETEATQGCAAIDGGAIRTDRGSGDAEVDEAARSAGSLGDRPLIARTSGKYWKPDDPVAAQQIAAFHETRVDQLQPELAPLSSGEPTAIAIARSKSRRDSKTRPPTVLAQSVIYVSRWKENVHLMRVPVRGTPVE